MKKTDSQRLKGQGKGNWNAKQWKGRKADSGFGDVIKIIDTITSCLVCFSQRFENHNSSTQFSIRPCPCINSSYVLWLWLVSRLCFKFQHVSFQVCFVHVVFVDLTLYVLFLSVLKNSKTHKNWKIYKKFDRLNCVFHIWVWPSTFILMA